MLEKHQWAKCTGTSFKCTSTPCGKLVVAKVYRYTWMRSAGIEQKCDPNAGAFLSIILEHEMTLEKSIKARG